MLAPDLVPGNPAAAAFSLSTLVVHERDVALELGPFDAASDVAVALWLEKLARRVRVAARPGR